jgi:hypothetical protein
MGLSHIDHWNYRVLKKIVAEEEQFGVYEVYYDIKDNIVSCTSSPTVLVGDSLSKAVWELNLMLTAFEKPTLNYEEITGCETSIGGGNNGDEE